MSAIKKIFAKVEGRDQRVELNLYVSGDDTDDEPAPAEPGASVTSGTGDADTRAAGEGTESAPSESESA
jgi:hypothetical protein